MGWPMRQALPVQGCIHCRPGRICEYHKASNNPPCVMTTLGCAYIDSCSRAGRCCFRELTDASAAEKESWCGICNSYRHSTGNCGRDDCPRPDLDARDEDELLAALREIARLRLATNEGSLRVRADRILDVATTAIANSRGRSTTMATTPVLSATVSVASMTAAGKAICDREPEVSALRRLDGVTCKQP